MSSLAIHGLHQEVWTDSSVTARMQALQDLETAQAAREQRSACTVDFIPDDVYRSEEERQGLRGYHEGNNIYINSALVENDQPYLATETLFHESRHAYQEHVANNPEQAEDPQQVQDWQMNVDAKGYLHPEQVDWEAYRFQPIEEDANQIARQRTDDLYMGEFGDTEHYPEYRAAREAEMAEEQAQGEDALGSDPTGKARDMMIEQYQANELAQTQEQSASLNGSGSVEAQTVTPSVPGSESNDVRASEESSPSVTNRAGQSEELASQQSDAGVDLEQDYDAYYGYGQ